MRTDDLINALVEDRQSATSLPRARALAGMVIGLATTIALFAAFLGIRADVAQALTDPHCIVKFAFAGTLMAVLLPLLRGSSRPHASHAPALGWLALPLLVLVGGSVYQAATTPSGLWVQGMIGRHPAACMASIPALAAGPLAALLWWLRAGAPMMPTRAGALAGALAGGVGAFIYALHCPDDSVFFVALWYSLAVALTATAGAALGRRLLRW